MGEEQVSNSNDDTVYYEDAFGRLWVKSDPERLRTTRPKAVNANGVQYEWAPLGGPESVDDLDAMGLAPGPWSDGLRPWRYAQLTEAQRAFVDAVKAATGRDIEPLLEWDRDAVLHVIGRGYFLRVLQDGVVIVAHERDQCEPVAHVAHGQDGLYLSVFQVRNLKEAVTVLKALHHGIGLPLDFDLVEAELLALQAEMAACIDDIDAAADTVAVSLNGVLADVRRAVGTLNIHNIATRLLAAITAPPLTAEELG
jgi:hypothetical protein